MDRQSQTATTQSNPVVADRARVATVALVRQLDGVADEPRPETSPIRAQVTPQGILIQPDDIDALDRFEQHVQMIAGPRAGAAAEYTQHLCVFYLTNDMG
jgi:hypothetical protein